VKGGSAAPHKNGKATNFVPDQTKPKKKVSPEETSLVKAKRISMGHYEQVRLSTKGSTTSAKFDFVFCVEEQQ
jgi:hypothetical protein